MTSFQERALGRYRVQSLLGAGGMGEVYRALDTELGREVAVKLLPREFAADPERVRRFEIEARAAAAISHPNILAIFDVGRSDGTSYLVTELLEGETLRKRIASGGLTVATAVGYAIQAAHGLAAAHAKGVLHRDLKTDNLFLTTDGRVKILDFGLAKLAPTEESLDQSADTVTGAALGTVGYMAPEVLRGQPADVRSDLFSLGVVLYELVSGRRPFPGSTPAETVAHVLDHDPLPLPREVPAPLQRIVRRCLEKRPEDRFSTAHDLALALESLHELPARLMTAAEAGEPRPYPGLASFTEADAAYFFGREAEVEELWRRIPARRLLAVIGPSGAGKSSFLRAGVIPAAPGGWSTLLCQPGEAPFASLARALVPAFIGDEETTGQLFRLREPEVAVEVVRKWRRRRDEALLIVDQLEELFTLNPPPIQASFAALLGRLADEADVHVLLAMRDDFFFECSAHPALVPVFENATPLRPPTEDDLRRAVVKPAQKHGFGFEDDGLVDEMVVALEGERGALPMLAFTLARLWEQRDAERKLLSRGAYERLGGVSGALAQHAEATLARIGEERLPVVRELFRNLVTAQGTRAVREVDELLSVFDREAPPPSSRASGAPPSSSRASAASRGISRSQGDRQMSAPSEAEGDPSTRSPGSLAQDDRRGAAEEVLAELVDARLLTSYEIHGEGEGPSRRVEIVHESLLTAWPRLVRWQTQDADAARLRDELRQAARVWDEHERAPDFLWSGRAYREFALWRETYPGGLSGLEDEFAAAMSRHAQRRLRRRRMAAAAIVTVFLTGLAVIGSLWQRSVRDTHRAEAAELLAIGQLRLADYPTAAVAYATKILELADSQAARRLALEALWKGPTAMFASEEPTRAAVFTPDGRWLVQKTSSKNEPLRLIGADGSREVLEGAPRTEHYWDFGRWQYVLPPSADAGGLFQLVQGPGDQWAVSLWSAPERRKLAEAVLKSGQPLWVSPKWWEGRLMFLVRDGARQYSVHTLSVDGEHRTLGTRTFDLPGDEGSWKRSVNYSAGHCVAIASGGDVYVSEIGEHGLSEPRLLGRQPAPVVRLAVDPLDRFVASSDRDDRIRLWSIAEASEPEILQGPTSIYDLLVHREGGLLRAGSWPVDGEKEQWIWSLEGRRPELVRRFSLGEPATQLNPVFDLAGRQLVNLGTELKTPLWRMSAPADAEPLLLKLGEFAAFQSPVFHPDGRWLALPGSFGISLWTLTRPYPAVIRKHRNGVYGLVFGPEGRWLASGSADGTVRVWPLEGEVPGPGRVINRVKLAITALARSPEGDRLLAGGMSEDGGLVRLLSLGEEPPRTLAASFTFTTGGLAFGPGGRLAAAATYGPENEIIVWDVASGEQVAVLAEGASQPLAGPRFLDSRHLMALDRSGLRRWEIPSGASEMVYKGSFQRYAASGDGRRALLVEAATHQEPGRAIFLDLDTDEARPLTTHGDRVWSVALDATGAIAVTGDDDGTVRVGAVSGDEPHLLLGHEHKVVALAVDPLGRWIASGSADTTVRLWPMPDLSKPPFHTLPRQELIAKLKTLTNLRVVREEGSDTGWKLEVGPFPGWKTVPSW